MQWCQACIQKMGDVGAIKSLEILPLIDWYTSHEKYQGEAGVSYLIKTEKNTILFDVGYNPGRNDPSPLLHNMTQLGVTLNDFDTIVISHNHPDHVGGMKWMRNKTFSLTSHQIDLGQKKVYTPVPMTYPNLNIICSRNPTVISKGVATIGTIPRQLFFMGWTLEQALAINLEGKGIVLIVGCGHQTLQKIIDRGEALFDEPIYGLVGGLHYPVKGGREKVMGVFIERYIGTGKPPWRPITMNEVEKNIQLLKSRHLVLVGPSPHDSCDASLAAFRSAFPDAFRDVAVGKSIFI